MSRLFCAIDRGDKQSARTLVEQLAPHVDGIKLGLEFFAAQGPQAVTDVTRGIDLPLFLDLKFHDIPNTVGGAVRSVTALKPALLTIHAAGGHAMIAAARDAAPPETKIIAVTILTSLSDQDLAEIGMTVGVADTVLQMGRRAIEAGADGLVCSPHEVAFLRAELGPDMTLVVPGIRPDGSDKGDQSRVMTPGQAQAAGADILVIGRPITGAADPAVAARAIRDSLAA